MKKKNKIISGFQLTDKIIMSVLILSIILLVNANVICRYVLSSSFSWSNELVQILFFWMTMIGTAIAFREGDHMGMDLLKGSLKPLPNRILDIIVEILSLIYITILGYEGTMTVIYQMSNGKIAPSVGCPMWIVTIAITIGCGFSIIWIIRNIVFDIKFLIKKEYKNEDLLMEGSEQ